MGRPDPHMIRLLRSGSAKALCDRILAVFNPHDLAGGGGGGLAANEAKSIVHSALMDTLRKLSDLRLRVFVRALQELCMPSRSVPEEHRAWHVAAASMAVNATIAAAPPRLSYDSAEQLEDFERSPFLTRAQKNNLLKLLVPLRYPEKVAASVPRGVINPKSENWKFGTWTPAENEPVFEQPEKPEWDAFDHWPYRVWDPRLPKPFADPAANLQVGQPFDIPKTRGPFADPAAHLEVGQPFDIPKTPSLDTAAQRFKQMVAAIEATY